MVIFILFHSGGFRCFKHYHKEYVRKHLKHLFSRQVSYNRFVELKKEAWFPSEHFNQEGPVGNLYMYYSRRLYPPLVYVVIRGF